VAKTSLRVKQKRQQKHGVRAYTRCTRGGRSGAVYLSYKRGRIGPRPPPHEGAIPGMTKSSW
jgi:small subunit ribosomal protein S14